MEMKRETLTPDSLRWDTFVGMLLKRLPGPSACNHSHRHAKAVMHEMGNVDIEETLVYCEMHGGYCDCEILLNVDPSMVIFGEMNDGDE